MFSIAFSNIPEDRCRSSPEHVESLVNDLLSDALLAIQHHVVDQTGDHLGIVNRIGQNVAFCDMLPLLGTLLPSFTE